jgi:hypothetical protein
VSFLSSSQSRVRCWLLEGRATESRCVGEVIHFMYGGDAVLARAVDERAIRAARGESAAPTLAQQPQYLLLGETSGGRVFLVDVANVGVDAESAADTHRRGAIEVPLLRTVGKSAPSGDARRFSHVVVRGDLAVVVVDDALWILDVLSCQYLPRLECEPGPAERYNISDVFMTEEAIVAVCGDQLFVVRLG